MSAEPRQTTIADAWSRWQSQVVQGRFVLRRCLGWSDQGAVFLTEHKARNLAEAAIKFVRADAPQAQPLLVRWQAAVNLSHPNLVQLFEVGRWQVEGQDYLFVVMEYGDQTLAEILRRRALSAEEVQELLPPVLDALTFLHRRQLVHSQLKPSNFLAVGDQLKLASDTIRPAGQDHGTSSAGDVWNLGATLVEAITARARMSSNQRFDEGSLPAGLQATLVETMRRCLSASPDERPSIIELRAEYKLASPASKPEPQVQKVAQAAAAALPASANTASRSASQPQLAPNTAKEVTPSKPTQTSRELAAAQAAHADSRVTQPAPSAPSAAVSPQPAQTASRLASLIESVPIVPEEAPPLQPIQTASRVTVSFHTIPSGSPAAAQAQPASSASPGITPPRPANVASPAAASAQPVSSAPRQAAPPQPANGASPPAARSQSASTISRDVAPPQAANIAPGVTAPAQPVLSTTREITPPQVATIAPRVTAPAQSVPSATREVAPPQAANISPRVTAPAQPVQSAMREVTPLQVANIAPRAATPAQPVPSTPRVVAPPRPAASSSQETAPSENAPKRHILGIAAGALLLATAVWISLRSTSDSPAPLQPAALTAPVTPPAPEKVVESKPALSVPASAPLEQPATPAATSSSVINEVLPNVPEKIQDNIQGRLYVTVRVLVDPAGNVMGVLMENPGPSKYFARLSDQAAREWQFVPADTDAARVWLLEFKYTRDGVAVRTLEQ